MSKKKILIIIVISFGVLFLSFFLWNALNPESSVYIFTDKQVYRPGESITIFMLNAYHYPIFAHSAPITPIITNPNGDRVYYCGLKFQGYTNLPPYFLHVTTWDMIDICNEQPLIPGIYEVKWWGKSAKDSLDYIDNPSSWIHKGSTTFEIIDPDYVIPDPEPNIEDEFGVLGQEHVHAGILVRIYGDKFDFSAYQYQIKSDWIHFEGKEENTIHRHASGVTLEYLFETLNITVNEECYIFPDIRQFCTNEDYSLKFYINGENVNDIRDYEINESDRILISYGNEDENGIAEQLNELEELKIIG